MSNALARLRQVFEDELFIRAAAGMEPTPRALELGDQVSRILRQAERMMSTDVGFDARQTRRQFTARMSDLIGYLALPRLTAYLAEAAPNISLNVVHLSPDATLHARRIGRTGLRVEHGARPAFRHPVRTAVRRRDVLPDAGRTSARAPADDVGRVPRRSAPEGVDERYRQPLRRQRARQAGDAAHDRTERTALAARSAGTGAQRHVGRGLPQARRGVRGSAAADPASALRIGRIRVADVLGTAAMRRVRPINGCDRRSRRRARRSETPRGLRPGRLRPSPCT